MSLETRYKDAFGIEQNEASADVFMACKIVEDFALKFLEYMRVEDTQENAEKYFHYEDKDFLEEFKNQYK